MSAPIKFVLGGVGHVSPPPVSPVPDGQVPVPEPPVTPPQAEE